MPKTHDKILIVVIFNVDIFSLVSILSLKSNILMSVSCGNQESKLFVVSNDGYNLGLCIPVITFHLSRF